MLVVGHADLAGSDTYILTLSEERADSIAAFLRDRVDPWLAWYGGVGCWRGVPAKSSRAGPIDAELDNIVSGPAVCSQGRAS